MFLYKFEITLRLHSYRVTAPATATHAQVDPIQIKLLIKLILAVLFVTLKPVLTKQKETN